MGGAIFITMTTNITSRDLDDETYIFQTNGTIQKLKSSYYLRFDEVVEDMGTVHNTMKIEDERLTVIRQGPLSMRQQLEVGKETNGMYHTPIGSLPFSVEAKSLDFQFDETTFVGRLNYTYVMKLGSPIARQHEVTIEMKGAPKNEQF